MTPTDRGEPRHFAFVDSLRCVAILGVLVVHVTQRVPTLPGVLRADGNGGQLGVQLFFVVSSCTLFWSLHSRWKSEPRPILAFFVRRLFRVAPLFWSAAVAYLWLLPADQRATAAPNGIGLRHVLATLLFVHGWYPTTINSVVPGGWSIAAEAMFYLLIPLLFRVIRTARRAAWLAVLTAMAVGLLMPAALALCVRSFPLLPDRLLTSFVLWSFPSQLPVFLCGTVAYFFVRDGIRTTYAAARGPILLLAVLIAFDQLPAHVVAGVTFAVVVCAMSVTRFTTFTAAPVRFIGTVSYSVYIWHFAVLNLLDPLIVGHSRIRWVPLKVWPVAQFGALFIVTFGLSVAAAAASYYLVERPGMMVGRAALRRMRLTPPVIKPGGTPAT